MRAAGSTPGWRPCFSTLRIVDSVRSAKKPIFYRFSYPLSVLWFPSVRGPTRIVVTGGAVSPRVWLADPRIARPNLRGAHANPADLPRPRVVRRRRPSELDRGGAVARDSPIRFGLRGGGSARRPPPRALPGPRGWRVGGGGHRRSRLDRRAGLRQLGRGRVLLLYPVNRRWRFDTDYPTTACGVTQRTD